MLGMMVWLFVPRLSVVLYVVSPEVSSTLS